jgi:hypothetical protein
MSVGGTNPAGSSRILRLDPFSLPVSFSAGDARADERVRFIELDRERVVMRRAVAGIRMAVSMPVTRYLGVALRLMAPDAGSDGAVAIVLEHEDPAMAIPLYVAPDATDVLAEWQSWARVLGLPLLVHDGEGVLREPFARLGALRVAPTQSRRRRRTAVRKRHPRILMRRQPTRTFDPTLVHRGEREIVARS